MVYNGYGAHNPFSLYSSETEFDSNPKELLCFYITMEELGKTLKNSHPLFWKEIKNNSPRYYLIMTMLQALSADNISGGSYTQSDNNNNNNEPVTDNLLYAANKPKFNMKIEMIVDTSLEISSHTIDESISSQTGHMISEREFEHVCGYRFWLAFYDPAFKFSNCFQKMIAVAHVNDYKKNNLWYSNLKKGEEMEAQLVRQFKFDDPTITTLVRALSPDRCFKMMSNDKSISGKQLNIENYFGRGGFPTVQSFKCSLPFMKLSFEVDIKKVGCLHEYVMPQSRMIKIITKHDEMRKQVSDLNNVSFQFKIDPSEDVENDLRSRALNLTILQEELKTMINNIYEDGGFKNPFDCSTSGIPDFSDRDQSYVLRNKNEDDWNSFESRVFANYTTKRTEKINLQKEMLKKALHEFRHSQNMPLPTKRVIEYTDFNLLGDSNHKRYDFLGNFNLIDTSKSVYANMVICFTGYFVSIGVNRNISHMWLVLMCLYNAPTHFKDLKLHILFSDEQEKGKSYIPKKIMEYCSVPGTTQTSDSTSKFAKLISGNGLAEYLLFQDEFDQKVLGVDSKGNQVETDLSQLNKSSLTNGVSNNWRYNNETKQTENTNSRSTGTSISTTNIPIARHTQTRYLVCGLPKQKPFEGDNTEKRTAPPKSIINRLQTMHALVFITEKLIQVKVLDEPDTSIAEIMANRVFEALENGNYTLFIRLRKHYMTIVRELTIMYAVFVTFFSPINSIFKNSNPANFDYTQFLKLGDILVSNEEVCYSAFTMIKHFIANEAEDFIFDTVQRLCPWPPKSEKDDKYFPTKLDQNSARVTIDYNYVIIEGSFSNVVGKLFSNGVKQPKPSILLIQSSLEALKKKNVNMPKRYQWRVLEKNKNLYQEYKDKDPELFKEMEEKDPELLKENGKQKDLIDVDVFDNYDTNNSSNSFTAICGISNNSDNSINNNNNNKPRLVEAMQKIGLRWERFHFDFDGTKILVNT